MSNNGINKARRKYDEGFKRDALKMVANGQPIREGMTEDLVIEPFEMLLSRIKLLPGCIVHSDRGGQYASKKFVNY